jgi:hypothetical protein
VKFEDPVANKPGKKQRLEGNNNDTNDASGNFEIIDLTEDSEGDEEDFYTGEDPYFFISYSEIESDSD